MFASEIQRSPMSSLLLLSRHVHMDLSLFLLGIKMSKMKTNFSQTVILFLFDLKVALLLWQRSKVLERLTLLHRKLNFSPFCRKFVSVWDVDVVVVVVVVVVVTMVMMQKIQIVWNLFPPSHKKRAGLSLSRARARSKSRLPAPDFSHTHSCETRTPGSGVTLGSAATATWYPCTLA